MKRAMRLRAGVGGNERRTDQLQQHLLRKPHGSHYFFSDPDSPQG